MNAKQIIDKWDNAKFPALREMNKNKVDEYIEKLEAGVTFPPVLIAEFPKDETYGEYAIVDGNHRLAAYLKQGGSCPYQVKKFGSVAEALTYAYTANMAHGLPVSETSRNKRLRLVKKLDAAFTWQKAQEVFGISKASFYDIIKDETRGEKPGRKKGTKVSKSSAHKNLEPLEEKPFFKALARVVETLTTKKAFNELVAFMTPATDKDGKKVKLDHDLMKMCKEAHAGLAQLMGNAEAEAKG